MILESELEREAFDYICERLGDYFADNGCNDLEKEALEKFKSLKIKRDDAGIEHVRYDFDIITWLREQIRDKDFGKVN